MFETLKNAWKVADIRKKLLFTLMIIVLYRLGSAIPVPFVDGAELSKYFENASVAGSLLGYFNLLSGDAFSKATLFALNISPYITASIVIQLLTVAIPALEKMAKSGPEGQQKLNKITRIVTIALSLVMAYGYYVAIKDYLTSTGFFPCLVIVACFTAGASLTMWLGERIDENGIGNGISMVLFAGIVARGPQLAGVAWEYIASAFNGEPLNLLWVILALAFMVAVVIFVIHITDAERRLPVQYAKRVVGRKMYGGQSTHLPMKVNMSGVMPIIFAQSIASVPATIVAFTGKTDGWVNTWFSNNSIPYAIIYFLLIIFFAYFYSTIQFNPVEVANNLKKNGGYIPGFRPGKPTSEFIQKVLNKITLFGAIYLGIIAIVPILISHFSNAAALTGLSLGGTSIIIVVGVALETVRALEAQMLMRNYKGFLS